MYLTCSLSLCGKGCLTRLLVLEKDPGEFGIGPQRGLRYNDLLICCVALFSSSCNPEDKKEQASDSGKKQWRTIRSNHNGSVPLFFALDRIVDLHLLRKSWILRYNTICTNIWKHNDPCMTCHIE